MDKDDNRKLRSVEEIESIAISKGDAIWIENLQSEGLHDLIEALFAHHKYYDLNEINSSYFVVVDKYGEFIKEHLTTELLDAVTRIANELYRAFKSGDCGRWQPDDYRPLLVHFSSHLDEWDIALQAISIRNINKYGDLMEVLPAFKETAAAPALLSGTL